MKDNKYIKKFNEHQENLNISDVRNINKNDWNDIMTQLEVIENLEKDEYGFGKYITYISNRQGYYCDIRLRDSYDTKIADGWGETKKESIYNCVIDFYNNL